MAALMLTVAEAADRLGVKPERLRALVKRREIGHLRDGRFLRFTEQHLTDYVAACDVPRRSGRTR